MDVEDAYDCLSNSVFLTLASFEHFDVCMLLLVC